MIGHRLFASEPIGNFFYLHAVIFEIPKQYFIIEPPAYCGTDVLIEIYELLLQFSIITLWLITVCTHSGMMCWVNHKKLSLFIRGKLATSKINYEGKASKKPYLFTFSSEKQSRTSSKWNWSSIFRDATNTSIQKTWLKVFKTTEKKCDQGHICSGHQDFVITVRITCHYSLF